MEASEQQQVRDYGTVVAIERDVGPSSPASHRGVGDSEMNGCCLSSALILQPVPEPSLAGKKRKSSEMSQPKEAGSVVKGGSAAVSLEASHGRAMSLFPRRGATHAPFVLFLSTAEEQR